jgi:hypothetical protein
MNVSDLNGLEFAELLHQVCERLEQSHQCVVAIDRPNQLTTYIVVKDDDMVCCDEDVINGEFYMSTSMSHVSSRVKL